MLRGLIATLSHQSICPAIISQSASYVFKEFMVDTFDIDMSFKVHVKIFKARATFAIT